MKRFLSDLLACFTQSRSARRHYSPQRRVFLEVECLERREVPSATLSGSWHQEPGTAYSIASGGGQIWSTNADNGTLSRWTGSGWQQVADPHGINFLAVDQNGNPLVIDGYNDIWRLSNGSWQELPFVGANAVSVGANGSIWAVGAGPTSANYNGDSLFQLVGNSWKNVAGPNVSGSSEGVQAVAVDPSGNPWIIGDNSEVYHYTGSGWTDMGTTATSIAVGADGATWITGTAYQAGPGGYLAYEWTSSGWAQAPTNATGDSIAVTSAGTPWMSNSGPVYMYDATPAPGSLGTSPNAIYIENLYSLLLNRTADPGAAGWVNLLNQGVAPSSVVAAIETSSEYLSNAVTGIYQHYLNRTPDPAGLSYWVGVLQGSATIEQVIQGFIASPEFYQVQGGNTNAGFVTVFYQDILGRAPDSAGFNYWLNALNTGAITPAGLAHGFLYSQEYENNGIGAVYLQLFGRAADSAGLNYWTQLMQAGWTDQAIVAALLGSAEGFNDWS